MSRLSILSSPWWTSPPPSVGLAVSPQRVSGVAIACRDGAVSMLAHASVDLAPGVVVPSLTEQNVRQPEALTAAVAEALAQLPSRPRRVALALPDAVAKVSLVRFDKVPQRAADLEQLVRWQVRKSAPFPLEEAQVAFFPGLVSPEGGQEFVVCVARRDVVCEYEQACARAGVHAGAVDIAALAAIDAAVVADRVSGQTPAGDWLFVHLSPGWCTLAIVRRELVIFFRSRGLEGEENLADLVHQTAMYYEDRLGGSGFSRVVISDTAAVLDAGARRDLEERLGAAAYVLDPRQAATVTDRGAAFGDLVAGLVPPLGVTLREWVA